jgi:hypothetical protein
MPEIAPRLEPYLIEMALPSADLVASGGEQLGSVDHQLASGFSTAGDSWQKLKRQREAFDQLYRDLEENAATASAIRAIAARLEKHEKRLAAEYVPALQQIAGRLPHYQQRKKRDRRAQSMVRLGEEIIEIGISFLELLQNTRLRLLRLALLHDGEPPGPTFSDPTAAKDYLATPAE